MKTIFPSFNHYLLTNSKTRWQLLIAGLFVVVGITKFACKCEWYSFAEQWGLWIEAYISVGTLFIVGFVWLNERKEEYIKSLPKKLNITFKLNGIDYITVKNAPLAGDDDIRAWGQSIAKTIINGRANIDFSGFNIETIGERNRTFLYHLTIYLKNEIREAKVKHGALFEFDDSGQLKPHDNISQVGPTGEDVVHLSQDIFLLNKIMEKLGESSAEYVFLSTKKVKLETQKEEMLKKLNTGIPN